MVGTSAVSHALKQVEKVIFNEKQRERYYNIWEAKLPSISVHLHWGYPKQLLQMFSIPLWMGTNDGQIAEFAKQR